MEQNAIKQIQDDMRRQLIIVVAQGGHGKSSMIRNLVESTRGVRFKVFDNSFVWYHESPMLHRIRVKPENASTVPNINNVVYEIGELDEDQSRAFIARIIQEDYMSRYYMALFDGIQVIDELPPTIYIVEESNTIFGSTSLNKPDEPGAALRKFASVGRNYGLRGVFITTAAYGELATKIRRRAALLLGQVLGNDELSAIGRRAGKGVKGAVTGLERFHWLYWNGHEFPVFRSEPYEGEAPLDYVVGEPEPVVQAVEPVDLEEYAGWAVQEENKPTWRGWYIIGGLVVGILIPILWLISFLGF